MYSVMCTTVALDKPPIMHTLRAVEKTQTRAGYKEMQTQAMMSNSKELLLKVKNPTKDHKTTP